MKIRNLLKKFNFKDIVATPSFPLFQKFNGNKVLLRLHIKTIDSIAINANFQIRKTYQFSLNQLVFQPMLDETNSA